MPIRVVCPECKAVYNLADELRGKKIRCRSCEAHVPVPGGPAAKPAAKAPAGKVAAAPSRRPSPVDDEEEDLAPRKKKGKAARGKKKAGSLFDALPVWAWLAIIGGGGVLLIGGCIGGGFLIFHWVGSSPSEGPPPGPVAAKKTADQLVSEFSSNHEAFKENYDGKVIEITGQIAKIDGTEVYFHYGGTEFSVMERIRCDFPLSQRRKLKTLQPGQVITVQGKYAGKKYNFVVFEDCLLTKSESLESGDSDDE
jgi:hypothetical protein